MSATYRSRYEALASALPERDQRLLACRVARWALAEYQIEDPRSWEAVEVSERYADGRATLDELLVAAYAAWAAWDTACDVSIAARTAWAAADAAKAAVEAAAGYAAEAADWAARAAGRDARADAYKMFFEWALELMIGEEVAA